MSASTSLPTQRTVRSALRSVAGVATLATVLCVGALELLALAAVYDQPIPPAACFAAAPAALCGALASPTAHVLSAIGALAIFALARPQLIARLVAGQRRRPSIAWLLTHVAGVALLAAPLAFLDATPSAASVWAALGLWMIGAAVAAVGGGLAAIDANGWRVAFRDGGWAAIPIGLGAMALVPAAASAVQQLWEWSPISSATFHATATLLKSFGGPVVEDVERALIGVGDFVVIIGRECSGVEGFGLVTVFLAGFFWLFRGELRFPHALVLLPIGLAASWTLNVARIAILIQIGAGGSPELALDSFHSHAGWVMFILVAVGLALAGRNMAWFRSRTAPTPRVSGAPALFADPVAATILPFIAMMATGLLVATFSTTPTLFAPAVGLVALLTLALFAPVLSRLRWRLDPVAIGVGAAVGALWLATAPAATVSASPWLETLQAQGAAVFGAWAVLRVVGATVATPLVEELFFRGYVQKRLTERLAGPIGLAAAILVSAALFGALHDRWAAGLLAGVAFGLVATRRGGVADAIVSHAVANGVIALWAAPQGAWDAF